MAKVLVTGCQGQLARSLAERARTMPGVEVVCAGRPQLDLLAPDRFGQALDALEPDLVINAAAYTAVDGAEDGPELAFAINRDGAGALAAAAAARGLPFVQISTDYVFDGEASEPYAPDDEPSPLGAYGRSKLEGEQAVRDVHRDAVVVRTSWVYSPFGTNFLKTMMVLGAERDEVAVVADQIGNPTSALDLADGLLAICARWKSQPRLGLGQTYHVAGSGDTSWYGFARHIFEERRVLGLRSATARPIPNADYPARAARPRNSRLDSSKFVRDFMALPHWQVSSSALVCRLAGGAGA